MIKPTRVRRIMNAAASPLGKFFAHSVVLDLCLEILRLNKRNAAMRKALVAISKETPAHAAIAKAALVSR